MLGPIGEIREGTAKSSVFRSPWQLAKVQLALAPRPSILAVHQGASQNYFSL